MELINVKAREIVLALLLIAAISFIVFAPSLTKPTVIVIGHNEVAPPAPVSIDRDYTVITCKNNNVIATTNLYGTDKILISHIEKITCDKMGNYYINNNLATKQKIKTVYLKGVFYV